MASGLSARLEHTWDVLTINVTVSPCGRVDRDRLVAACVHVAGTAHPTSYIARRVDALAGAEGLSADEYLLRHGGAFVGTAGCATRDALIDHLWSGHRAAPGLPFEVVVAPAGLGFTWSHELGDGHVFNGLFRALWTAYADGTTDVAAPTRVATDREILAALAGTWARRPRAIAGCVTGVLGQLRRLPPSRTVVDDRAVRVRREIVEVPEEELAVVDAWRRRQSPRPSSTTVLMWIVSRALRDNGYPDPQRWQVMANMRGATERWSAVGGNLVGRVLVEVGPEATASDVTGELRRQTGGGELLLQHVLKMARLSVRAVRARLRGGSGSGGPSVGRSPGLSWSDLGRHADGGIGPLLPARTAGGDRVRPGFWIFTGPFQEGIGATVAWLDGRANLAFTFGASPLDDDAVDAVLATLRGPLSRLLPGETARAGRD